MLRKLVLTLLIVLTSVGVFAQDLKFGHVSIQELAAGMPEMIKGRQKLETDSKFHETELAKMYEDLNKKYADFTAAKDSLPETIKARRVQELQDLEQRFNNFRQSSTEAIQKQQQELERSVMEAIMKAVKEVGEENGYLYIFDKNSALYISATKSTDVNALVKAKLDAAAKAAAKLAPASAPVAKPAVPATAAPKKGKK